jgi:hypothetical protein
MRPRPATQPGFFVSIGTRPSGVELPSAEAPFAKSALDYSAGRSVAFTSAGRPSLTELRADQGHNAMAPRKW